MTQPQLNADQQNALKKISAFILTPDKEFFLTGGPGVGKTFTTRELANLLPAILHNYNKAMGKKEKDMQLVLTSTTNKAASVLSAETGHEAQTIHSFLGLVPKSDYQTGVTLLKRTAKWQVHYNKMIFIDEASMIENNLYMLIQEATDKSCKIIYIGDKNQLPPVKEKLSPAVRLSEHPDLHYEIQTPVRNANSPALLDLCNRLKTDIELETAKPDLTSWTQHPGEIIYVNGDELQDLVEKTFGPNGTVKPDDEVLGSRILAYTNQTVIGYNNHIRTLLSLPNNPVAGEILVNNSHFQITKTSKVNAEEEVRIHDVEGPHDVAIDDYNSMQAYSIEISSSFIPRSVVKVAADRNQYLNLLRHYKKNKDWKRFYRLQEMFIDLRNREAATVYKAQGSTYDEVIMIMDDIFTSRDINQLRRMLYVGASRARKRIYVYDKGIYENKRGIYQ